jgi:hypothetical protein
MTKVVCNASPIIGLSILGKLDLLWELFEVLIPNAVYNEVVNLASENAMGRKELRGAVNEGLMQGTRGQVPRLKSSLGSVDHTFRNSGDPGKLPDSNAFRCFYCP